MATFFCSECNFSKPVKDEMAGKKARCPKCNAVNVVPELGHEPSVEPVTETDEAYEEQAAQAAQAATTESTESQESTVTTSSPEAPPEAATPATETAAPASEDASASATRLSMGWLMIFGGAMLPFLAGALLLSFKMVSLAMICFAVGMLAFSGLAAYYSFT